MIKNDHTYEYRVFTHRLIDVEAMEVGKCTSKIIKELKPKDKVNGRFFHTSDTDEWFFCWNGELQKLNIKGNSDVNAALAEVKKLIGEANAAVADAKKTATEAKDAADAAKVAADNATSAAESIENKADKTDVEAVTKAVELKADKTVVDALEQAVETKASKSELDEKADKTTVEDLVSNVASKADADVVKALSDKVDAIKLDAYATKEYVGEQIDKIEIPSIEGLAKESFVREEIAKIEIPVVPTKVSELDNDANYLTSQDISGKQDIIDDLETIRANANLGATALQSIPSDYITEDKLEGKGYLTADVADKKYAPIGSEGVDLSGYATKEFVTGEIEKINVPKKVSELENDANYLTEHQDISGKQDVIGDLETIRANANLGATALQEVPAEYITDAELTEKGYLTAQSLEGYAKVSDIPSLDGYAKLTDIPEIPEIPSMDNYYTKEQIDAMIGVAIDKTNTILA